MTKSLIEADGSFVGAYDDNTPVPDTMMLSGRSIINSAPDHAIKKWNGKDWVGNIPPEQKPVHEQLAELRQLLAQKNVISSSDVAVLDAPMEAASVDQAIN